MGIAILQQYRIWSNLDVLKHLRHRNACDGELSMLQKHMIMVNFKRERNPGFLLLR